jgi:hypothetical protein
MNERQEAFADAILVVSRNCLTPFRRGPVVSAHRACVSAQTRGSEQRPRGTRIPDREMAGSNRQQSASRLYRTRQMEESASRGIFFEEGQTMKWGQCRFGSIEIDGEQHTKDVILDRGKLRKRQKKLSRSFRDQFGHTPLSVQEDIPWNCKRLVIGTGMAGRLPVMDEVVAEAKRRGVELILRPTPEAVRLLEENPADTNAILHLTC